MKAKTALCALLAFILLTACTGREAPPAEDIPLVYDVPHHPAWPALALIETGGNPLWFELGPLGPAHILSPQTASLKPYTPWPHARFVAGIMPWEGLLVLAVNLDGFLVLGPAEEGPARTILHRVADSQWAPYTVGSFFTWRDHPAALLYRNAFFGELYPHPPQPQVFVLDKNSPAPLPAEVPALHPFPPGEAWEAEALRRGPSGYWYYRMRDRSGAQNRTAYFRARNLEGEAGQISQGAWRNSDLPEGPENIPPLLSLILDDAAMLAPGETAPAFALRTISPGFEGSRFFRSAPGESMTRLYAFYRENLALLILPDGRGLYSRGNAVLPFSLPPLPEGFVYTGVAILGDIVLASWEEQQGAGIGAAGFMLRDAFPQTE